MLSDYKEIMKMLLIRHQKTNRADFITSPVVWNIILLLLYFYVDNLNYPIMNPLLFVSISFIICVLIYIFWDKIEKKKILKALSVSGYSILTQFSLIILFVFVLQVALLILPIKQMSLMIGNLIIISFIINFLISFVLSITKIRNGLNINSRKIKKEESAFLILCAIIGSTIGKYLLNFDWTNYLLVIVSVVIIHIFLFFVIETFTYISLMVYFCLKH